MDMDRTNIEVYLLFISWFKIALECLHTSRSTPKGPTYSPF